MPTKVAPSDANSLSGTVVSIRRDAISPSSPRQITVMQKFRSTSSRPYTTMKRDITDIQCHNHQIASLRQDFLESARFRGITSNRNLTDEEITEFKKSYQQLCQNSEGLSRKELIHSLLDHEIFFCKADAIHLCKLLPRTKNGYIKDESIVHAANDITIHQRRKLQKYIRLLPTAALAGLPRPHSR